MTFNLTGFYFLLISQASGSTVCGIMLFDVCISHGGFGSFFGFSWKVLSLRSPSVRYAPRGGRAHERNRLVWTESFFLTRSISLHDVHYSYLRFTVCRVFPCSAFSCGYLSIFSLFKFAQLIVPYACCLSARGRICAPAAATARRSV